MARRPVLKIHGSIDNFASIVASSEDYEECERRLVEGALGAVLKQIFATKTLIFCGYSAKDGDFLTIYNTVRAGLGAFARTHYIVSPYLDDEDEKRLSDLNLRTVKTDATYFLGVIKSHMVSKFPFAKDEAFAQVAEILPKVIDEHLGFTQTIKPAEKPHLVFANLYQDGLIHALQRILDLMRTGEYSDLRRLSYQIDAYDEKLARYQSARDYWEIAYFTGYVVGLEFFIMCNAPGGAEDADLPLYFHPGIGPVDRHAFAATVADNPDIHKGALRQAKRVLSKPQWANVDVVQHLPWG
jgi:hypothetical protein